jgi:thiol:disulfide interchange protein DsbD
MGSLLAMLALAGVLLALRAGGEAVGWGFQLQSPMVVALLALVMIGSALNLMGLFEAGLGLQRAGQSAGGRDGLLARH